MKENETPKFRVHDAILFQLNSQMAPLSGHVVGVQEDRNPGFKYTIDILATVDAKDGDPLDYTRLGFVQEAYLSPGE